MQRFYISNLVVDDNIFVIQDTNIIFQLVKVLRSQVGERLIAFNGVDLEDHVFEIQEINKRDIKIIFIETIVKNSEASIEISLLQALPNKLEKLEYIVQKGVEIGIKNFILYRSERSQKLVVSDKKEERLKKIMIEAVEQSGGNIVPKLEIKVGAADLNILQGESIFLHTKSINSLLTKDFINLGLNKIDNKYNILIGPEGGFSEDEIKMFEEKNMQRVHLGNRILRTETAGVVTAFTLLQML